MRTLLVVCALCLSACFPSFAPLTYQPQPLRIEDPKGEIRSLILGNTSPGCVTEPTFDGSMLVVKAVCYGGIGNTVARLDRIRHVSLEKAGEWYGCRVTHQEGIEDFLWTSRNREDMQRMVDAFTALTDAPARSAPMKSTSL